jgi:CO/xanthine dehydrogenase FAD-binding subunit
LAQAFAAIGEPHLRNHCSLGGALHYGGSIHAPVLAALMALDASVVVMHRSGSAQQPIGTFSERGQRVPLPAGRLASEVVIAPVPSSISGYVALEKTVGLGPASGIAVCLRVQQGIVEDVRLVLAGFTEQPVRLTGAEAVLRGQSLTAGRVAQAMDVLTVDMAALDGSQTPTAYALHLMRVLIRRALSPHLAVALPA